MIGAALRPGTGRFGDAAERLMFKQHGCPWCLCWKQEVGFGYTGDDFFWGLFSDSVSRLPRKPAGQAQDG